MKHPPKKREPKPTKKRPWTRLEKLLWLAPVSIAAAFWLPSGIKRWQGYPSQQVAYPANQVAFSPSPESLGISSDGKTLVTCDDGHTSVRLHVWNTGNWRDVKTGNPPVPPTPPFPIRGYSSFCLLPDAKTLIYDRRISGPKRRGGVLQAVDVPSQRVLWRYNLPHLVRLQSVSKDGRRIAVIQSLNRDVQLAVLDSATGKALLAIPKILTDGINSLSPDGKLVAVVQKEFNYSNGFKGGRTVQIWRVADGKLLSTFQPDLCLTTSVLFSPDGGRLFVAGNTSCSDQNDQSRACVYDLKTRTVAWSYQTQWGDYVRGICLPAWSPDGKRLVFLCDEGLLVFDAQGTRRNTFHFQLDKGCKTPSFSPDNKTLYGLSNDSILMWDLD